MTDPALAAVAASTSMVERTEFSNEAIWLPLIGVQHLNAGHRMIEGKTFTDCLIEGPAVLVAAGDVSFDGCRMGVAVDPKTLLLKPLGDLITGAIVFRDCKFIRCNFRMVGYTGNDGFLNSMAETLGAANAAATAAESAS